MKFKLPSRYNQYDVYIIIIIASLAAGYLGGVFLPFRIITILLFPKLVIALNKIGKRMNTYITFVFFFFIYMIFSFLWVPSGNEYTAHLAYCIFHFILFLEIVCFSQLSHSPLTSISTGWLIAVALTLVVAMWEITTDNHLSISKQQGDTAENLGHTVFVRQFASVTFFNYNTYVTFLCFAMPFLFYKLLVNNSTLISRLTAIICVILSDICILFNASRGGLIAMLLMLFLFFIVSEKKGSGFLYFVSFLAIIIFSVIYFGDALFTMIGVRAADGALFEGSSRFEIWQHAFDAFKKTYGLGTGLGGLQAALRAEWNGISVTHNIFLEVLVEFGLIIFICFIVYLYRICKRTKSYASRAEKITVYLSLITLPVVGIIDAGYLVSPFVFAYFASLSAFSDINIMKRKQLQ